MLDLRDTCSRSLKLRLILPMCLALVGVTAGFATWDYVHTRDQLIARTADEARRFANSLRSSILHAKDISEIQRLVDATADPNPAISLIVVTVGGDARIIASSDPAILGMRAEDAGHPDLTESTRDQVDRAVIHTKLGAVDHTTSFVYRADQSIPASSPVGAVMLHYSVPQLHARARAESIRSAGTMLMLVVLFAGGGLWALDQQILSRLYRLREAVQKFGQDRTIADLQLGQDEIGDLTQQILRSQREFASRELQLETIVSAAGDGIIFLDPEGRIIQFNRAAEEIFGYEAAEVLGESVGMLMVAPHDTAHDAHVRRYVEGGEAHMVGRMREETGRHRDGHTIPLVISVADVITPTGRVFVSVIRDLTEQQRAESNLKAYATALESATMRAESSAEAKAEFLANMSHEIRTPMTAILGYVDLLMDPHTSEDDRRAYLKTVKTNGEHLLSLINDILDLSKIEADRVEMEKRPTEVVEVVGSVVDLLHFRAREKGIRLQATNEGPIPRRIITDPTRLRQILVNLVGNAIKFTSLGGVTLRVRYPIDGQQIHFDVEDTGIGMEADKLEQIFEAFGQAEASTTRNYGGTGLGLTISRKLAHKLGGEIHVRSTPDVGSVFTVSLPLAEVEEVDWIDDLGPEIAQRFDHELVAEVTEDEVLPTGGRVLLAEDNPVNQKLIQRFLEREGVEVFVVDDGSQACTAALDEGEAGPFDLILMDMIMPTMDGYQATAFLREQGYEGTIVALTANAMEGDRDKCLQIGCDDYLTKPIQHEEFRRVLRTYIHSGAEV